jgi:chromosome segregation ATPase
MTTDDRYVERLLNRIAALKAENAKLREQLALKDARIVSLKVVRDEQAALIREQDGRIAELEAELAELAELREWKARSMGAST